MRISMKWLSEFVDLEGISAEEIQDKLTMSGVEVERIHKRDTSLRDVVVGHVLEVAPHPNADKLTVCRVDIATGTPATIVCGAPNVAAGQRVPVAKVGAVLPNLEIKEVTLRGVLSEGMICSASELGLEDNASKGIMVLSEEAEVGRDVTTVLDLDDDILELDLTPNRSDCLSMVGVAYEVAALFDRELRIPHVARLHREGERPAHVRLDAGDDCTMYALQVIHDIRIGPSPQWMQNRLMAAGMRPINNIVDITNYVMLEYGQPLHAFDYDEIHEGTIVVRHAEPGETFVTLDGVERTLDETMALITDGSKPVALAGVMGGANSEIRETTQTVLIESAYFSPMSTSRTSRKLGLRSEASARFEKGVDPERVIPALRRAAQLMCELADGHPVSDEIVAQTKEHQPLNVPMRYDRMNALLGTRIAEGDVRAIFDRLRFDYEDQGDRLLIHVPARRPDITIEADLIEEVARLYGYDRIPRTLPGGGGTAASLTREQALKRRIRRTLQGMGLSEVITYALTSPEQDQEVASLNEGWSHVRLQNPLSEERSVLRTGLLPGLIEVAEYNIHRQETRVAIYEIGRTFGTDESVEPHRELPHEEEELAGLLCGPFMAPDWLEKEKPLDFFRIKGVMEGLFRRLGVEGVTYVRSEPAGFHPGRTAELWLNGRSIGYVGQLHPRLAGRHDLPETYVFQLKLAPVLEDAKKQDIRYEVLPLYPAVTRDLAVVVADDVPVGDLLATIREAGAERLEAVKVFDVFIGEQIGSGKKSVAFSLVFRDPARTLTDAEVDTQFDQIMHTLYERHKATLR